MYLATLCRDFSSVSTYFIAILEGVGGGGATKKATVKKQMAFKKQHATTPLPSTLSLVDILLEELGTSDRLDVIRPVYTYVLLEPPDR